MVVARSITVEWKSHRSCNRRLSELNSRDVVKEQVKRGRWKYDGQSSRARKTTGHGTRLLFARSCRFCFVVFDRWGNRMQRHVNLYNRSLLNLKREMLPSLAIRSKSVISNHAINILRYYWSCVCADVNAFKLSRTAHILKFLHWLKINKQNSLSYL